MTKDRRQVSTESPGMRRVVAALEASAVPLNGHLIAAAAHVAFNTFQNQYRHILEAAKKIYLHSYDNNVRGPFVPLYMAGPAPAGHRVRKPKKLDQLARARNWKERSGYNAARKAARRLRRPPDRVLAALMGMAR
jgi:hypothetical protein